MKNLFVALIIGCFICFGVNAQSKYEAGMEKAFGLWGEGKAIEATALFERIGQAEAEKWVPLYHAASVMIFSSFNEADVNTKNNMLEKAKTIIAQAHTRSENNSEITTLEGMLYTAYVAMDPETYGMTLSPKIMALHNKAIELNPDNPRALANLIEYEMGSARFFGNDLAPFCDRMKEIIPKFENQVLDFPFAPSYGIERAKEVANSCND